MKYLPLIWYGIWRKRGRTILIFVQIAVAFLLFGLMHGIKIGIEDSVSKLSADLFFVHRANGNVPLPIASFDRVKAVPGVKHASYQSFMFGTYQKPTQRILAFAVDVENAKNFPSATNISVDAVTAMQHTRTGMLVSRELVAKYGWKVGDRIPLEVPPTQELSAKQWTFDVVGIVDLGSDLGNKDIVVINYAYFDEARIAGKGTIANIVLRVADVKNGNATAQAIDKLFANSSDETKTESLLDLVQDNLQAMGDLDFIVRPVLVAVLLALLLSVSAMMMQSIRERMPELAVLKTVGFSDRKVFGMIVAESLLLCSAAAFTGLALAWRVIPFAARAMNSNISMPSSVVMFGVILAIILAVACVVAPAWRGLRLSLADALAGR